MKLTRKQKSVLFGLSILSMLAGLAQLNCCSKHDGIPEDQGLILIKKEIVTRKTGSMYIHKEGLSPAKQYAKLSFDTDGSLKTAEVTAIPEIECWEGIDEVKPFKIFERRSLKDWNSVLEKAGWDRKKSLEWDEGKSALLWRWQRLR